MKIKDLTNNSSCIELSSDEAAKVNGGYDSYLFGNMNPDTFSTFASQGGSIIAQTQANRSAFYRDFRASGFNSMSEYALYRMRQRSIRG